MGVHRKFRFRSRMRFVWFASCDASIAKRLVAATIYIRNLEQVVNRSLTYHAPTNVGFPTPSPHRSHNPCCSTLSLLIFVPVRMYHLTTLRFYPSSLLLLFFLFQRCPTGRPEKTHPPKLGSLHAGAALFRRGSNLPGLVTSPRLFCPAPLPKNHYGIRDPFPVPEAQQALAALGIEFPPRWSYLNFSSLQDLCSIDGRTGANFGGQVQRECPIVPLFQPHP